jgi:hypothetical protein
MPTTLTEALYENAQLRLRYANLLAAARATLTATYDGDPDALGYLIDELAAIGQLPPLDAAEAPGLDPYRLGQWLDAFRPRSAR